MKEPLLYKTSGMRAAGMRRFNRLETKQKAPIDFFHHIVNQRQLHTRYHCENITVNDTEFFARYLAQQAGKLSRIRWRTQVTYGPAGGCRSTVFWTGSACRHCLTPDQSNAPGVVWLEAPVINKASLKRARSVHRVSRSCL